MYRMLGMALFAVGVVLLVMGVSAADSIGSEFSRLFTGRPTDRSIWLMVGGVVSMIVGAGGFMASRRS